MSETIATIRRETEAVASEIDSVECASPCRRTASPASPRRHRRIPDRFRSLIAAPRASPLCPGPY